MTDTSVTKPTMKDERRQLVWRFLLSFGLIAGTVAVATMIARWMR